MLYIVCTLCLICMITYMTCDEQSAFQPNSVHITRSATDKISVNVSDGGGHDEDIPIILWWTSRLLITSGRGGPTELRRANCPRSRCYNTANRSYLNDSRTRVLYFYGSDLEVEDLPFPRARKHEWALSHEESPFNNYIYSHGSMMRLFNHTATFKRESDYPLTSQCVYSLKYLTQRQPLPVAEKNKRQKKMHLAPILYVQSHCGVASDRDRYVKELMKYVDIDAYGPCLNNKKMPPSLSNPMKSFLSEEYYDFIADYKFHLACENAICNDYMTEKLFRPLHVGSVPIYRGSARAKDWMPDNKSMISIDDFASPKDLADYIKYLDANDEAYEKYLLYKKDGGVTNSFLKEHLRKREWGVNEPPKPGMLEGFECYLCDQVSARLAKEREHKLNASVVVPPPKFADNSHMGCAQPYTSLGDPDDIMDKGDEYVHKTHACVLHPISVVVFIH